MEIGRALTPPEAKKTDLPFYQSHEGYENEFRNYPGQTVLVAKRVEMKWDR